MGHFTQDLLKKVVIWLAKSFYRISLATSFLVLSLPTHAGLPDLLALIKPGVVAVGTLQKTRRPPSRFSGTGFVVANGRYVVTNAHVIPETIDTDNMEHLAVFVGRGKKAEARKAKQVAVDLQHDLAILKIEGAPLQPLRLGDSNQVREGQSIAFTGFPIGTVLGLFPVTHRGIISSLTPIVKPMRSAQALTPALIKRLKEPYEVFQLDATAYPGNSGSPVYNQKTGEVIGVLNMVFVKESKESMLERPSGISYAIPIKYLRQLLEKEQL